MREFIKTPEQNLTPPEPMPAALCLSCGGEIYSFETYGLDSVGSAVCVDCLRSMWGTLRPDEQFSLFGFTPVRCEYPPKRRFRYFGGAVQ